MAHIPGMDNFNEIEASGEYKPAPIGDYKLVATESDVKPNKKGTGYVMEMKFEIIEGQQKGKSWRQWYNIVNENETAQRIGQSEFKSLALAVGFEQKPQDSSMLCNKPFLGHVIIEENGQYTNNKIQSYTRLPSTQPAAAPVQVAAQPAAKKPWE